MVSNAISLNDIKFVGWGRFYFFKDKVMRTEKWPNGLNVIEWKSTVCQTIAEFESCRDTPTQNDGKNPGNRPILRSFLNFTNVRQF